LEYRHSQSALNELPESWNEKAADRGDDVAGGSLSGHLYLISGKLINGITVAAGRE